jgi:formylglycine-generating enzyme required for sulfatase activity
MASLFISYSRRNIDMARRLVAAFEGQGLDFWIDWEGIEPTLDWWKEICKGIEEADNFVFLISPDSIRSRVCGQELGHAVTNGKRLIPVVILDVKAEDVPPELGSLNWIFLRDSDDFQAGFARLVTAIRTDYEWVQAHRRLQVRALEWERSGSENSFLLRGRDLQNAESMVAGHALREPYPTELQRSYLLKSRQVSDRQRRTVRALAVLGLLALLGGVYLFLVRPYQLRAMAQGEMASIAAGPVILGSDDPQASEEEMPAWTTQLQAFDVDRYEVSNRQYGFCVAAGACQEPNDPSQFQDSAFADYPVAGVSAFQADDYCRWLGKRLPTELQWERAARGPDGRPWPWGDSPPTGRTANLSFDDAVEGALLPVDSLPEGASPPPEQVYQLVGNVWEWTSSYEAMDGGYEHDPGRYWDSAVEKPVAGLVQRGGSWDDNTMERVTRRDSVLAGDTSRQVGIRCAKSP